MSVLLLLPLLFGCSASTSFKPPNNHEVYLGMEKGEFTLIKDSVVAKISEKPDALLEGNSLAQATAVRANKSFSSGKTQIMAGSVLSGLIPILGWVMLANGQADMHTGIAKLIDAMNMYNDQASALSRIDRNESQDEELTLPFSVELHFNRIVPLFNGQVHVKCTKRRESAFFSTLTLSFGGVVGIDKKSDGAFDKNSRQVEKGDAFYVRLESMLLHVTVDEVTDDVMILSFGK